MKRVVIMGNAASGKSTLSMKMKTLTCLPVFHMDKILWKKNWERTSEDEFIEKHTEIINKEEWILEGVAYKSTYRDRFEAADTIIYLDTHPAICKERAVKRAHEDAISPNPYVNEGCPYPVELIDKQHEVIDLYDNEYREFILDMIKKYTEKKVVIHLETDEDVNLFLESL